MTENHNLWPIDLERPVTDSTLDLLLEQASALGNRTKNVLTAAVKSRIDGDGAFIHSFDIVAPLLNDYSFTLFEISHSVIPFPLRVTGREYARSLESKEQLRAFLLECFSSNETRDIVNSLIVQSAAVARNSGVVSLQGLRESVEQLSASMAELEAAVARERQVGAMLLEAMGERHIKRYDSAVELYRAALKVDPSSEEARIGLAVSTSYIDEPNHFEEAIVMLDDVIRTNPRSAKAFYNRGTIRFLYLKSVSKEKFSKQDVLADLRTAIKLAGRYRHFSQRDEDLDGLKGDDEFNRLLTGEE